MTKPSHNNQDQLNNLYFNKKHLPVLQVESCFYPRAKFGVSYATTVWAMTSLMY